MKKLLPLLLILPLAGCEQTRPPSAEGIRKAKERTSTGTQYTKLELRTQPEEIVSGGVTICDYKVFHKKDTPEGRRKEWKLFLPLTNLDRNKVSEVLMRSWLVEKDGTHLESLRPAYKGYGSFMTDFLPPRAGDYIIFTEYHPDSKPDSRSERVVVAGPLPVEIARKAMVVKAGSQPQAPVLKDIPQGAVSPVFNRQATQTGEQVKVTHGTAKVLTPTEFSWSLAGGRTPESAEMMAVSPDTNSFLRLSGTKGNFVFTQPGRWRVWFTYEKAGQRFYAPYVIKVS